jgi:hypothetical protein
LEHCLSNFKAFGLLPGFAGAEGKSHCQRTFMLTFLEAGSDSFSLIKEYRWRICSIVSPPGTTQQRSLPLDRFIDYKPLDVAHRAKIWSNLSAELKTDDTLNEEGFQELARDFDINGRKIKNMLRTAWSLAKHESEERNTIVPLSLKHIKLVAEIGSRPLQQTSLA